MEFSVVIPTHKRKRMLKTLLQSLEQQIFSKNEFEVLVIATENDEAFQLIKEQQDWTINIQMTSVPNDPYAGKSASVKRNYGAKMAKGEWIAFIDDDCIANNQWLQQAYNFAQNATIKAIEGHTQIPKPEKLNLSYKGLIRLSQPKGYQTCNIFYKKKDFLDLGGFDPEFPFYLEDTDFAWTFIKKKGAIEYCEKAIVEHPVGEAQPKRLLSNAFRFSKLPYLYKKHPQLFMESKMRAFPRPYFIFVFFDFLTLFLLVLPQPHWAITIYGMRFVLTLIYVLRMYRGCTFYWWEILAVFYYTLICPIIGFFQLIRGNLNQRTFLFYR